MASFCNFIFLKISRMKYEVLIVLSNNRYTSYHSFDAFYITVDSMHMRNEIKIERIMTFLNNSTCDIKFGDDSIYFDGIKIKFNAM